MTLAPKLDPETNFHVWLLSVLRPGGEQELQRLWAWAKTDFSLELANIQ